MDDEAEVQWIEIHPSPREIEFANRLTGLGWIGGREPCIPVLPDTATIGVIAWEEPDDG